MRKMNLQNLSFVREAAMMEEGISRSVRVGNIIILQTTMNFCRPFQVSDGCLNYHNIWVAVINSFKKCREKCFGFNQAMFDNQLLWRRPHLFRQFSVDGCIHRRTKKILHLFQSPIKNDTHGDNINRPLMFLFSSVDVKRHLFLYLKMYIQRYLINLIRGYT